MSRKCGLVYVLAFTFIIILLEATGSIFVFGSDQSTITGYNTYTGWGPTGVGVASDKAILTVNLLTGTTYGSFSGRGDITGYNETSAMYYVAGTGLWSLSLTGSYSGGLKGSGSGTISGTITGSTQGTHLNIVVSGNWNMELDASIGGMVLEMYLTYRNKPSDLSYASYILRYLTFTPIKEVGSIQLNVYPSVLSVSRPNTYRTLLSAEVRDLTGAPISGRKIRFDVDSTYPFIQVPPGLTNQMGTSSASLYITVPSLSSLPQQILVSASDPLTGIGTSNLITLEQAEAELKLTGVTPASFQGEAWLTDANNVLITGRVQGLNRATREVVADIDSVNGSYLHGNRPSFDQDDCFTIPVTCYTAGQDYKVTVSATDDAGVTVSDTLTIKYLGQSLVKITSVSTPDRVDPTLYDNYDVDVTVKTVSVEPTNLYVDLTIGTFYEQKIVQVQPGEQSNKVTFTVPVTPLQTAGYKPPDEGIVQTVLYTGEVNLTDAQQPQGEGSLFGKVNVQTDNGSGDSEIFEGPEIAEADIGVAVYVGFDLPYPQNSGVGNDRFECETKQWTRYSRHSKVLNDMVAKSQIFPQWVKALGVGIVIQWTNTGNIEFEVIEATVDFLRAPNWFPTGDNKFAYRDDITHELNTHYLVWNWGKNQVIPSGEYKVRVMYKVKYTVDGEIFERDKQYISKRSFFVNRQRQDPCGQDFDHQTLYEEKTYEVSPRVITPLKSMNQGESSTGSFNPGGSVSGVIGQVQPDIHTVSMVSSRKEPITLFLDWSDASADLDLTLIDPLGRVATYLYSEGLVLNGIPGVIYSGNDAKPEWMVINEAIEGEYLVSVYCVRSNGPVAAWLKVDTDIASKLEVNEHALGTGINDKGYLTGARSLFASNDVVYSRVDFSGIKIGDVVKWIFTNPKGETFEDSIVMEWEGDAYAYTSLDLGKYSAEQVVGKWHITVFTNLEEVSVATFDVEQPIIAINECLIATATYGTELADEVQFLRDFRDNHVLATFAGRQFMKMFNRWYYSFSPNVAAYISRHPTVKTAMKVILCPLIGILRLSSFTYQLFIFIPEVGITLAGHVACLLIGGAYLSSPFMTLLKVINRKKHLTLGTKKLKMFMFPWTLSVLAMIFSELIHSPTLMSASTVIFVLFTLTSSGLATGIILQEKTASILGRMKTRFREGSL